MKLGDRGSDVLKVQQFLIQNGYLNSIESTFGVMTKRAILQLQKDLNLTQTGIWSDTLYDLHQYSMLKKLSRASTDSVTSSSQTAPTDKTPSTVDSIETPTHKGITFKRDAINCYIINLNTFTTINFYTVPESLTRENTANWDDANVRGRSNPPKGYSNSGPRNINASFTLVADYCPDGIVETLRSIEALTYPSKDGVIIAPECYFKVGRTIDVRGVPLSINISQKPPYKESIFSIAEVSIFIQETRDRNLYAKDVEGGYLA